MAFKLERKDYFAIPILQAMVPGAAEHKQGLVSKCLSLRETDPGVTRSNQSGYHSHPNLHHSDDPHVVWLVEQIIEATHAAQRAVKDGGRGTPFVQSMWANIHESGGYNSPHSHSPTHWSGVYYVMAQDTRTGLEDDDYGGCIGFPNPVQAAIPYGSSGQIRKAPKDGLMLMFPGFLLHTVFPHPSNKLRISIAFNVNFRAPLQKNEKQA